MWRFVVDTDFLNVKQTHPSREKIIQELNVYLHL